MIQAIIFDFDGLILDTETPWFRSYREVLQQLGLDLSKDIWSQCVGTGDDALFDYIKREASIHPDEVKRRAKQRHVAFLEGQELRPGVKTYMETAKQQGLKIGIASSSTRAWVEPHLIQYGLDSYIDCIRTADDVERVKPDPALYIQAMDGLQVTGSEAIVFEDSPNGARAAKRAGLPCVIVPNEVTKTLLFDEYDLKLSSMEEMTLLQVIERIFPDSLRMRRFPGE